jgi:chromosome partitioning protein
VIIPMQAEYYAMEGLSELLRTINQVRKGGLNRGLQRSGILLTMVDRRTNLCREVCDEVRNTFGAEVFQTEIPRNVRLGEAPSFQKTIHAYDPLARGAIAYTNIALELLDRDASFTGDTASDPSTALSHTTHRAQEAS